MIQFKGTNLLGGLQIDTPSSLLVLPDDLHIFSKFENLIESKLPVLSEKKVSVNE